MCLKWNESSGFLISFCPSLSVSSAIVLQHHFPTSKPLTCRLFRRFPYFTLSQLLTLLLPNHLLNLFPFAVPCYCCDSDTDHLLLDNCNNSLLHSQIIRLTSTSRPKRIFLRHKPCGATALSRLQATAFGINKQVLYLGMEHILAHFYL